MSTGNRFEEPPAPPRPAQETPQPDERERAYLINRQVDLLLRAGMTRSAQRAADHLIKHERVFDLNFKKEFGVVAEEAIEESLRAVLGPDHVADAPIPTDRERPQPGENPEGKGQADFFVLTDPENPTDKKQIAVQMFLHGPTDRRTAQEVYRAEVKTAVQQAYLLDLEGVRRIPISMVSPDFKTIERAFTEWEVNGRRGSLADALSQREKELLATSLISQMQRFLALQEKLHAEKPELVILYRQANSRLDILREKIKKTGGHGSKSAPPADRERSPSATVPG